MFDEFGDFFKKGNVFGLTIGVIVGGALQKIVNSLVTDIILPLLSLFIGKIDFTDLSIRIGNANIRYGAFLTTIVNFMIIALSIFYAFKYFNKLNKKLIEVQIQAEELSRQTKFLKFKRKKKRKQHNPKEKICPYCLSEINIKATRCPYCTSVLTIPEVKPNTEQVLGEQLKIEEKV